jgi:hypothetical protein
MFLSPKIDLTKNDLSPKFNCWINGGDQITIDQKIEIFCGVTKEIWSPNFR